MTHLADKRLNDAVEAYGKATAQKVTAEGNLYFARLLLNDFVEALSLDNPQERNVALIRVKLEVQAYFESLKDSGAAGEGEAPAAPATGGAE